MPAGEAERAVAAALAATGGGCRERDGADGWTEIDLWARPEEADAGGLERLLRAEGLDARVRAEPETADWEGALRAYHRPVEVAGVLRVRPPWSEPRPPLHDVVVDPGMAFGTAQHATTRACLDLLAGIAPGGSVLDAGAGSGVLALAARRLGFDPVWAVDSDPLAVEATLANARRNGVGLRVGLRTIGRDALPRADVVLANLTATAIAELAAALPGPPPRAAVLSGLRPAEAPAAAERFARLGLRRADSREADGWTTVLMVRG